MPRVLLAWIGWRDLEAPKNDDSVEIGPIARGIDFRDFDEAVLLANYQEDPLTGHRAFGSKYEKEDVARYKSWLKARAKSAISVKEVKLTRPTSFEEIYPAAKAAVDEVLGKYGKDVELSFNISPGTSRMAAVWIILAKTKSPFAELIESSDLSGVGVVSFPFDISAEFVPDFRRKPDGDIEQRFFALPAEVPEFDRILHRSPAMKRVITVARRAAPQNIRVLIEGETGTGKEVLAQAMHQAMHQASPRKKKPFIAVNCGAIPSELVESELFGHERGSFSGATETRKGKFEEANGGTIFLDEIGELPLPAQVKILRVLQERKVTRIGSIDEIHLDVRVIAATNRNLVEEVAAGKFREDLFYRLAVVIIKLPPLRDREGDIGLLIDHYLDKIKEELKDDPGFEPKSLSPAARNLLLTHSWPGNVRELENTLRRLVFWSEGSRIEGEDVIASIESLGMQKQDILDRSLGGTFKLPDVLEEVEKHFLGRAMKEAKGVMKDAADLLGVKYQNIQQKLEKYDLENLKERKKRK